MKIEVKLNKTWELLDNSDEEYARGNNAKKNCRICCPK